MTYDPDRDMRATGEINPNRRPYDRAGAGVSAFLMIGLIAAFLAVCFWLSMTKGSTVITDTDKEAGTERSTTGAASQDRAMETTPTAPSQPR